VLTGAVSVTLFKVEVPDFKRVGEMATLLCNYTLAGKEVLYSVKWYKDNEEFYRYVPKSRPVVHSYKVEGVKVEVGLLQLAQRQAHSASCQLLFFTTPDSIYIYM